LIRLLAVPFAVAAVIPPLVSGSLPGTHVPLSPAAKAAGAVEVHQVAVTGTGARRVNLLVGKTAEGRLCIGSGSFFRCLTRDDAQPAYLLATYGGSRSQLWGTVVGLLGPEVARADFGGQSRSFVPRVRSWPGFPWRAVTLQPSGPNGRLPGVVNLYGHGVTKGVFVDMFGVRSACRGSKGPCTGDSPMAPVGLVDPRLRAARALALHDPRVERLLGTTDRIVQTAPWSSCGHVYLGAVVDISLLKPVSANGDFPFVSFGPEKKDHAYAEGVLHLALDGIDSVAVSVDLTRKKVVSISPSGDRVVDHGHALVKSPVPAGPTDKTVCTSGD
jgi:hypothetical protein